MIKTVKQQPERRYLWILPMLPFIIPVVVMLVESIRDIFKK